MNSWANVAASTVQVRDVNDCITWVCHCIASVLHLGALFACASCSTLCEA